jgi:hypothetical protein
MKTKIPPKRPEVILRKKCGVWVVSVGKPISHAATERICRALQRKRENRFMGNLAKSKAESEN